MLRSDKFWFILLGGVLIIAAVAALILRQAPASVAHIYLDGVPVESIDLSMVTEPYTFTVESGSGFNVVSVERGRICVTGADCPDSYCIRQGWISGGAVPIVCLPHRLIIRLDSADPPEFDAIIG